MAGGNDRSSAPDKGMGKLNLNATEFRPPPPAASQAPANHSGRAGAGKKGGKGSHGRTRAASDSRQRREDSRGEKDAEEGSEAGRGSTGRRGKGQGPRAVPRTKGGPARTDATSGSSPKPTGDLAFSGSPTSSSGPGRRGVRADFLLNFTSPHRENLIGANTERARGGGAGRGGHGGRGAGVPRSHATPPSSLPRSATKRLPQRALPPGQLSVPGRGLGGPARRGDGPGPHGRLGRRSTRGDGIRRSALVPGEYILFSIRVRMGNSIDVFFLPNRCAWTSR